MSDRYAFRRATMADLDLLAAWLARPHVRAWWSSDAPCDAEELDDPRVSRWIVSMAGRPFAFMQDYAVHGWGAHHFDALPEGSRGIDQYIGDAAMVGIGHGPAFVAVRMRALFDEGTPVIATDPHPDNHRAIAAYRKLGFAPAGPPRETAWGVVLPMLAERRGSRVGRLLGPKARRPPPDNRSAPRGDRSVGNRRRLR